MKQLVLVLALLLCPAAAHAQRSASPFLPAQHWAHAALRELDMRGAISTESIDAGTRSTTVVHAIAAFVRASSSEEIAESVRARAAGYAALLRAEYGEDETATSAYAVRSGGEYEHHDGRVAAGDGYDESDWTGARPRVDVRAGRARLGVDARTGPVAFTATGIVGEESRIAQLQGVARLGDVQFWAGRRTIKYGPATESIVINPDVAFDGAGMGLVKPARFPSLFGWQGRVHLEGFVARLDSVGVVNNPWFLGARLSLSPHPRFTAALSRGAIFGGDDNTPVTFTNLMRMMIGLYSGDASDFENQIISFDMRYRVPRVPLVLYYEWGMDDGSGAWLMVPGITAGATLPLEVGGTPLDITFERTSFDPSCCGNPIWYRHGQFKGSWASDGVMIGHPLGGEGSEHAAMVGFSSPTGTLRGRVRGFVRTRGEENVYSPERAGRSAGGEVELALRAMDRLELELNASTEQGERDWSENRFLIGARLRLMQRQ